MSRSPLPYARVARQSRDVSEAIPLTAAAASFCLLLEELAPEARHQSAGPRLADLIASAEREQGDVRRAAEEAHMGHLYRGTLLLMESWAALSLRERVHLTRQPRVARFLQLLQRELDDAP